MPAWSDLVIGVFGGDRREQEIARQAAATGATVRAFGFPFPESGIDGVANAIKPHDAIKGARFAIFPMAAMKDGMLYAPSSSLPIIPDRDLLSLLSPQAHIVLGTADAALRSTASSLGITLHECAHDRQLRWARTPAVVEGAVDAIIRDTEITIHGAAIAVFGYGPISALLAKTLRALGADVQVLARSALQRAEAVAMGHKAAPIEAFPEIADSFDIVISSVPAAILGADALARVRSDALIVELASPPGGIDLDAAKRLGLKWIWPRGLGSRAPISSGRHQWAVARSLIARAAGLN